MLKQVVRGVAMRIWDWAQPSPCDDGEFAYGRLNAIYTQVMAKGRRLLRPAYTWAMIQAAHLASSLGVERFSAIEFGVAGGNGLVAMERAAERLEPIFGVAIEVHGFDSGRGLPPPRDHRDLPNLWSAGAYPMDEAALRRRLRRAVLRIGLVRDTVGPFLASGPAPVGFVAFDLDQYRSTVEALRVLEADPSLLMPRVQCHFDDILGFTYADHNGERLAIREFNAAHPCRQISPIYGLRFYLPPRATRANWSEKVYLAHILDHPRYGNPDGLVQRARMDLSVD